MRSSFISSKHIFSFMLSEIWPFVYPTQYFGKEILFFSKTKKYWREEGLRSEQLPNFLHILMFLKFSKFKSFIQLNVCILNIAGFFSSQGEKKKKERHPASWECLQILGVYGAFPSGCLFILDSFQDTRLVLDGCRWQENNVWLIMRDYSDHKAPTRFICALGHSGAHIKSPQDSNILLFPQRII